MIPDLLDMNGHIDFKGKVYWYKARLATTEFTQQVSIDCVKMFSLV